MKTSIVIIEDNLSDIVLLREALAEHGVDHEALVLEDGEEACRYFAADTLRGSLPCLIILDLNLPKRNGLEVLVALRKSAFQHVPVVVLTTSDSPHEREAAEALGVRTYLRKPVDFDSFLSLGGILKEICRTT